MTLRNFGYACQNLSLNSEGTPKKDRIFTDRTLRLSNFNKERAGELAVQNCADLIKILKWNKDNNIKFFRIGSGIFPFMDHPTIGYSLDDLRPQQAVLIRWHMKEAGDFAKANNMRLSCHPGPYTCISSPDQEIVAKSIKCLEMHSLIGDLLGYGDEFAINIHVGGVYENKHATSGRFLSSFCKLDDRIKRRLTLENDDKASMWSMSDLFKMIAKYCTVKLVLDIHHHKFCNQESLIEAADMAFRTWGGFCEVPKVHYSESRDDNRPQAHSNWAINEIPTLSDTIDYDVMLETKMKDQALISHRRLYANTNNGNAQHNRSLQVLDA